MSVIASIILSILFLGLGITLHRQSRKLWVWQIKLALAAYTSYFCLSLLGLFLLNVYYQNVAAVFLNGLALPLFLLPIVSHLLNRSQFDLEMQTAFPIKEFKKFKPSFFKLFLFNLQTRPKTIQTHLFKNRRDQELEYDLWPASDPNAPCVVHIFGGGFTIGSKEQFSHMMSYYHGKGYHVLSLSYKLMPEHVWPDPLHDIEDNWSDVIKNLSKLKIDPKYFILTGRSAGAQLCMLLGYKSQDRKIKGIINLYAPADYNFLLGYSYEGDILDSTNTLKKFFSGDPKGNPRLVEASPYYLAHKDIPATLSIHGKSDSLVPHPVTEHLGMKLTDVGAKHFEIYLPFEEHAYDLNLNSPGGQRTVWAIDHFLKYLEQSY